MQTDARLDGHLNRESEMRTLLSKITGRRVKSVAFCETCGQVCTPACRSSAHIDRVTTAAYRARL
jgi:hypothetical protein